ncbi:MAG: hypothetical protein KAG20_09445 [Cocleimonas sp.]|nr:hypothetical protein [Cocleimonas sp.]
MLNKWGMSIALSVSLLSGVAISADSDELTSYTKNITHNHGGGGRGVDTIPLVAPKTAANRCAIFNSATLKYRLRRYGDANITAEPRLLCNPKGKESCTVDVSWKHSPAGGLNYKVKLNWKVQAC